MELSKYIRKIGLAIHIAGFRENVVDTWNKSSRNPELFIKKIQPILKRYEKSPLDTKDIEQLKKDVYEGTDNQVELLWKINRFEVIPVREKVHLSEDIQTDINILRGYLKGLGPLFDKETPEVIKTFVNKIMKTTYDKEELSKIHDKIKESIKSLKNPKRKEMLQFLVLKPIQVALKKITPMELDFAKRLKFRKDLDKIRKDRSMAKEYSEKLMLETKTKGAPEYQIRQRTQKIYSKIIKKIAHLLINNLHCTKGLS